MEPTTPRDGAAEDRVDDDFATDSSTDHVDLEQTAVTNTLAPNAAVRDTEPTPAGALRAKEEKEEKAAKTALAAPGAKEEAGSQMHQRPRINPQHSTEARQRQRA